VVGIKGIFHISLEFQMKVPEIQWEEHKKGTPTFIGRVNGIAVCYVSTDIETDSWLISYNLDRAYNYVTGSEKDAKAKAQKDFNIWYVRLAPIFMGVSIDGAIGFTDAVAKWTPPEDRVVRAEFQK
jgi:hypothetical protein